MSFQVCHQLPHTININNKMSLGNLTKQGLEPRPPIILVEKGWPGEVVLSFWLEYDCRKTSYPDTEFKKKKKKVGIF